MESLGFGPVKPVLVIFRYIDDMFTKLVPIFGLAFCSFCQQILAVFF